MLNKNKPECWSEMRKYLDCALTPTIRIHFSSLKYSPTRSFSSIPSSPF